MVGVNVPADPRAPYRLAFGAAILIAILVVVIASNAERIEAWRSGPAPAGTPPCRIDRIGQVAHLTVRLAPTGELLATCSIVTARKS